MSEQRFIKFIPGPDADFLLLKPNAFALLTLVANRARREEGLPDGLHIGECFIGDHECVGLTRQQYRTALCFLNLNMFLTIIETCRTRQKSTTGTTTVGTKVKLTNSKVWDLNLENNNHQANHRPTTGQPPANHEQEGIRKKKIEKEITTTKPPSFSASADCVFVFHGPFVKLKPADYEKLCAEKGKAVIDGLIVEMNDYCLSTHTKGYKDYAAALRQWCRRRSAPVINGFNKTVDRRTKDVNGTPVSSPHDGRF